MGASLPISSLINVTVNLSPNAAQSQSTSVALVLGNSPVIDTVTRMRRYFSLSAVAGDFGTTAPEYYAAVLWFEQTPQPAQLNIGRWAQTASAGQLIGAPLTTYANVSAWTGITAGSFKLQIDGGAATDVTGMNFAGAVTMQGVAAIMQTAARSALSDLVTIVWNAAFQRFEITSPTTGSTSSVAFLLAAASGTDISLNMAMRAVSSGAYTVVGVAAETAVAAAALFDTLFGQQWYALVMPTIAADADHVAVANFIEVTTTKHLYGVTTQEAAIINNPSDTANVAYLLKQLSLKRTFTQFSSTSTYAVISFFARILTVNYAANASTITLMYKQEPGIVAEALNATQLATALSFNANVFVAYNNNTAIIQTGVDAAGFYADVITGTDNFALQLQTDIFNLLYLSPTKIPQTDDGTHQITSVIKADCVQFVNNGFIAPGVWTVGGFGNLKQGDFMPTGFYIYAPSVSTQNPSVRGARVSVPIQVAIKLAGAVQTVNVSILVNQ